MTTPSFANSFWGDNDKGLDVLISRMKNGKHVTAEVGALFKERAAIEEEFGKRLAKLAKAFTTTEEIGTLRESLDLVKAELETSARAHLDIANEIRIQLEKPVTDFLAGQSVVRKNHHANIERRLKNKSIMTINAQKAKTRYVSKCQEVNQLSVPQPNLQPKEAEKHQQRLEKAQQQAHQNDLEYVSSIERLQTAHTHWEEDYRVACTEFQKLEEDRIDYLRGRLWAYANIISTLCVADDESCERIRSSLEKCVVTKDIEKFVDANSTGLIIPAPLQYVNFYTGTSERTAATTLPRTFSASMSDEHRLSPGPSGAGGAPNFSNFATMFKKTPGASAGGATGAGGAAFGSLFKRSQTATSASTGSSGGASPAAGVASDQVAPVVAAAHVEEDADFSYDPYDFSEDHPVLFEVRVLYDYQSQAFEELTVARGQIVPVIAQHEDG
ncbi:UNVERIFIED_CONTAM: hypothetical protein HDU68_003619, partial [Siphonaria sp. JEL0065]